MRTLRISVLITFVTAMALTFGGVIIDRRAAGRTPTGESLAAPTGVKASDNQYSDKVKIEWETIRGATLYRVFRSTANDPGSGSDVGSTAANYLFDRSAAAGQIYFYWVRSEGQDTVSGLSSADDGVRANGQVLPGAFNPLEPPPVPAGNDLTAAKAYLGKTLFWDEQLSATKTVACGTCHRPASGGSDPRTALADQRTRNPGVDNTFGTADDVFGSIGVPRNNADGTYSVSPQFGFGEQVTGRKAPSYLNAGYASVGLFWDGRAGDTFRDPLTNAIVLGSRASLESQVLGPPVAPAEMGHDTRTWSDVAVRVAASRPLALATDIPSGLQSWIGGRTYAELFQEAFGTAEITPARIAMAIATHERTLFSDQTPFDRSLGQIEQLTPAESRGFNVFTQSSCNQCHSGPVLSENSFHNIGVRPVSEDLGRGAISGLARDNGAFKTPTLRNVELRAPYMHNGRLATLEEVVEFYDRGGDNDAPNINRALIRPLNLTATNKSDLVAFLKRPLTDVRVRDELPPFDRPRLFTESSRVPVVSGTGRAGAGGIVPAAIAIEPPLLGNPSFTVALARGAGNALAVVVIDSADPGIGTSIPSAGGFARVGTVLSGIGDGDGYGSVNISIPNDPSLVGRTFYGRWYVTDSKAANNFAVSNLFRFTVFGAQIQARRSPFDFDGDGRTDIGIFRPSGGEWWYQRSSDGGVRATTFGTAGDLIMPADFTGDGRADTAVWRPSTGEWFVLRSDDASFFALKFGASGDVPVPADYDGDGKADIAVFRPADSMWYILPSGGGSVRYIAWGTSGDLPVPADYDGDGKADAAIYRPSTGEWWLQRSTAGVLALRFGDSADKPVPADYTGDGKADVAVWRPSTGFWYVLRSEDLTYFGLPFGTTGDTPAPGDYDGDGKSDAAVFRPGSSTWFIQATTAGTQAVRFGTTGDIPISNAFVR